jgi:hypothetical protein
MITAPVALPSSCHRAPDASGMAASAPSLAAPAAGSTVRIPLANGKGFALVDEVDASLVASYSWYRHPNGHGGFYARAYVRGSGKERPRQVFMHQLLAGRGADHENGDGLDNRRSNLREAPSASQQGANTKATAGTSRFKGVYWSNAARKWVARITVNRIGRHLGVFADEAAAAHAYDKAAVEAWGQFARINFPEGR